MVEGPPHHRLPPWPRQPRAPCPTLPPTPYYFYITVLPVKEKRNYFSTHKTERESDGRASEFVARRMLSVGPAGSVNIPYGSRYLATTLYVTKRADHQQNSRYVKEREKGGSAGGEIRTGDLFRSIVPTGDTLTTGLRKGMC